MRFLLVLLLLSGCTTWTPVGTPALTQAQAEAKCVAVASEYPARLFYRDVLAGCMEREGWEPS